MFQTGIVLSGGGARCIAHLGILQGLEELGIRPDAVAGASAGAVLGALYATGLTPREILNAVKKSATTGLLNKLFSGSGLFTVDGLTQLFKDTALPERFDELKLPLWVAATDIGNSQAVVFTSGRLHLPLIGSCAVPGIIMPIHFEGHFLADGGILDNLPVTEIRATCQRLIGVNVNKIQPGLPKRISRLQELDRCFHLVIADQVAASAALCDIYLEPDLHRYPMLELKYPEQLFKAGYQCVMASKKELIAKIQLRS